MGLTPKNRTNKVEILKSPGSAGVFGICSVRPAGGRWTTLESGVHLGRYRPPDNGAVDAPAGQGGPEGTVWGGLRFRGDLNPDGRIAREAKGRGCPVSGDPASYPAGPRSAVFNTYRPAKRST